jgi:hypothetical protein
MKRQEAVLLLKEIMNSCASFCDAKMVSISQNVNGDWELYVSWMPHPLEVDCLEKIVANHSAEMLASDARTVFR